MVLREGLRSQLVPLTLWATESPLGALRSLLGSQHHLKCTYFQVQKEIPRWLSEANGAVAVCHPQWRHPSWRESLGEAL